MANWLDILKAYIDTLETSMGRTLFCMDFWSASQEEVQLSDTVGNKTFPTVEVADLPDGATVVRAIAMFKFRMIENVHESLANNLDGATVANTSQVIRVQESGNGTYVDAIDFVDNQFNVAAATREGGDVIIGTHDIASTVDANDTYTFLWLQAMADEDHLNFNDVQVGLRIWYSV